MTHVLILLSMTMALAGCVSFGPDFSGVEDHCADRGGSDYPGVANNPIYFTCGDGSRWKRASHGEYDFLGRVGDR